MCMRLAQFEKEEDYTRMSHFLYYDGGDHQLGPDFGYWTGLKGDASQIFSIITNRTIGIHRTSVVYQHVKELENEMGGLVYTAHGYYNSELSFVMDNHIRYFLCEETEHEGPNIEYFVSHGLPSIHDVDVVQPTVLQGLIDFSLKVLEVNLRTESGEHVLLGDQFTLRGGKEYCMRNGWHLFEPKNIHDMNFLRYIASKYELPEIWVGIYGTGSFPRDKTEWHYYSNDTFMLPDIIFEKIDQDNGVSFVGKSE